MSVIYRSFLPCRCGSFLESIRRRSAQALLHWILSRLIEPAPSVPATRAETGGIAPASALYIRANPKVRMPSAGR